MFRFGIPGPTRLVRRASRTAQRSARGQGGGRRGTRSVVAGKVSGASAPSGGQNLTVGMGLVIFFFVMGLSILIFSAI